MSSQQGDVKLVQTLDGGDVEITNGVTEMSGGLETSVYLALFGGNEDDDGRKDNVFSWWGNRGEVQENQYHSRTQNLLQTLVATSSNLVKVKDAATLDLSYLIELKIASSVDIFVSIPKLNSINIKVIIEANGIESDFSFTENWKATIEGSNLNGNAQIGSAGFDFAIYNETILNDNPVFFVTCNDDGVGAVIAESVNGFNGIGVGGVGFQADGLTPGDTDKSIELADIDYIIMQNRDIYSFTDGIVDKPFSLEGVFNTTDLTNQQCVLSITNVAVSNSNEYAVFINPDGSILIRLYTGTAVNHHSFLSNPGVISINTSYHFIGTYTGIKNSGLLYVNGLPVSVNYSETGTYTHMQNTNEKLYIGSAFKGDGEPKQATIRGRVAKAAGYAYILSQSQITEHFIVSGL